MAKELEIGPQEGPQMQFLGCPADVAIFGGGAGGGKTHALLLEPLRYITTVNGFGAVTFRRTIPQVTTEGGLWDESAKLYRLFNAQSKASPRLKWEFPPYNNSIGFAHLQYDDTIYDWDGSQIPLIQFDQLESFSKRQFLYMLSRNRSACGVKPYVRASCNPMPESWILELIGWYIDPAGDPIIERSGIVRWFIVLNEAFVTADTAKELTDKYEGSLPRSFTFIRSRLTDNKILMRLDPGYVGNLNALPTYERKRLLDGNWKARREGPLFKAVWMQHIDKAPALVRVAVGVDPSGGSGQGHDAQGIVAVGQGRDGKFYVLSDATCSLSPAGWGRVSVETYHAHKADILVAEGNFGGDMVVSTIQAIDRYINVKKVSASRSKAIRAEPIAALYEKGLVFHVGPKPELENELIGFDPHDPAAVSPNRMDALVWAITELMGVSSGILDLYRQMAAEDSNGG